MERKGLGRDELEAGIVSLRNAGLLKRRLNNI